MYAGDLADAVMKAATDLSSLPDLMNCGVGHDHSITTFYETVADVIGWDGEFTYDLSRPVGMKQKLCSIKRQSEWGWSAKTSFRKGVVSAYNFYLEEVSK